MSLKRRMDRLAAGMAGGSQAMRIARQYAAMSDAELLAEAEWLTRKIRQRHAPMVVLGPPSPLFAHLSDEELIAEAEQGRREIAERDAGLKEQS
jgi:hypothetical protein